MISSDECKQIKIQACIHKNIRALLFDPLPLHFFLPLAALMIVGGAYPSWLWRREAGNTLDWSPVNCRATYRQQKKIKPFTLSCTFVTILRLQLTNEAHSRDVWGTIEKKRQLQAPCTRFNRFKPDFRPPRQTQWPPNIHKCSVKVK